MSEENGSGKLGLFCPLCLEDGDKKVRMRRTHPSVEVLDDGRDEVDEVEVCIDYFCVTHGHLQVFLNVETDGRNVTWTQYQNGKKITSW